VDKKTPVGRRSGGHGARGCLAALLAVCWTSTFAAESLFLAGGEGSRDGEYAYLAAIIPFPGSSLGGGLVQRYWAEWLSYEYVGFANQVIEARSPGFEAALGYQRGHSTGYYGAYAGVYYRNVSLSPDDPTAEVRGAQIHLRVQLEGEQQFASVWRVNGIASYVFGMEGYWVRARLLRSVRGPILAGVEGIVQGDPDYKGAAFGAVVTGFEPFPRWNIGFKVGAKKIEDRPTTAYVGIEVGKLFGKP
jgi:hypothetical protein